MNENIESLKRMNRELRARVEIAALAEENGKLKKEVEALHVVSDGFLDACNQLDKHRHHEKILKAVVGIQAVVILAIMSHIALVLF